MTTTITRPDYCHQCVYGYIDPINVVIYCGLEDPAHTIPMDDTVCSPNRGIKHE